MNELVVKIQAVINTLRELEGVPTTYNNVDHILGMYKTLVEVRDALMKPEEEEKDAGRKADAK